MVFRPHSLRLLFLDLPAFLFSGPALLSALLSMCISPILVGAYIRPLTGIVTPLQLICP